MASQDMSISGGQFDNSVVGYNVHIHHPLIKSRLGGRMCD